MVRILAVILIVIIAGCKKYEVVDSQYAITAQERKAEGVAFSGCVIRYYLKNFANSLNEVPQKQAIDKAFTIWQKANSNVMFASTSDTTLAEIIIEFGDKAVFLTDKTELPIGLFRTNSKVIGAIKQIKGTQYKISLDKDIIWNENLLSRTLAYYIGNYLGFKTSEQADSIMFPEANISIQQLSKEDSILYKQKYSFPCRDLNVSYLPIKTKLTNNFTKEIKLEKAGVVQIKSTGVINAGTFIGDVTPEGKFEFDYLGVRIDIDPIYDIYPDYPHGAVMYRLNNSEKWILCKSNCEFKTTGAEYITLYLQLNDTTAGDNKGFFDVEVSYK